MSQDVIAHSLTVADINRQYPQCRAVFDKYGIAGCGGPDGPPEPLFIFAAAHRVELRQLVDELNAAVRGEWKEGDRAQRPEVSSQKSTVRGQRPVFWRNWARRTCTNGLSGLRWPWH